MALPLVLQNTNVKTKKNKNPKYASKIQTLGTLRTQYFQLTHEAKNNALS
jgi:hypothetical protein